MDEEMPGEMILMDKIIFRDLCSADLPKIREIVNDSWDWASLFEKQEALEATLGLYVNMALHKSSFTKVAVLDSQPVGVIMGYVDGDEPVGRLLMDDSAIYTLALLNTVEHDQKAIYEYLSKTQEVYDKLYETVGIDYDANLVFIAVTEKARGLNVGKQLWFKLLDYLKQKDVQSVYLFSDTECNFGFYDHMGFTKRVSLETQFVFEDTPGNFEQTIFLYDFRVV